MLSSDATADENVSRFANPTYKTPIYRADTTPLRKRLKVRGESFNRRVPMLTRLKVTGFKNLVDVDIRFGPFTCIAGANGVGKSNLFDAIRFLSALADSPLIDAALSVRDEGERTADIRSLFHSKI